MINFNILVYEIPNPFIKYSSDRSDLNTAMFSYVCYPKESVKHNVLCISYAIKKHTLHVTLQWMRNNISNVCSKFSTMYTSTCQQEEEC